MHDLHTTLVAVATPPGRGGIGCVRLSGLRAAEIGLGRFRPAGDPPRPGGRPSFGRFVDRDGRVIDHGYLVLFPAESSFTGELTAELWPHGSPAILAELIEGAVASGATPAGLGEFTYRALRHGRIDLARAEAVADLVAARTLYQARIAFAQAEGSISRRLAPLTESIDEWIARTEAAVEFVDESETHLAAGALRAAIDQALADCGDLLSGFRSGRVVRDGATLAIVGCPNAGKSSLFNRLLARERAIVHEIAGTTRDTLEETIDLAGIPVRLIDTAGLRQVTDPVEGEGVRRAEQARQEADLVLLVLDGVRPPVPQEEQALSRAHGEEEGRRTVIVINKSDLPLADGWPADQAWPVSARSGEGIGGLKALLRERLVGGELAADPILTNARHAQALERTIEALKRSAEAADSGLPDDLVLEDLKLARNHLGQITGDLNNEALYDRIFSTFCIGK